MHRRSDFERCSLRLGGFALVLACCSTAVAFAQQQPVSSTAQRGRQLSPGVLTVISPERHFGETFTGPRPLVGVTQGIPDLDWTPHYEPKTQTVLGKASSVTLRRPIWNLEFAFKPLRMIEIDVAQPAGNFARKQIWYLVYRVRNVGYDLSPTPAEEIPGLTTYNVERVNFPTLRFFPHFLLESYEYNKQYLDQILPAAKEPIQRRENPGVEIYNSVEMTRVPIPLTTDRNDRGVWGFVTWQDIDPRIDFFSVYIRGLTNAFVYTDPPGALKPGDPPLTGREYAFKTLRLNFWRPGDTLFQHERELHYGVPTEDDPAKQQGILQKYGLPRRLDYLWVYR